MDNQFLKRIFAARVLFESDCRFAQLLFGLVTRN